MLTKYYKWSFFAVIAAVAITGIVFIFKGNVTDLDINLPGNVFDYNGVLQYVFVVPAFIMGIWGFIGAFFADLSPYKIVTKWSDGSKTEERHSGLGEWVVSLFVVPLIYGGLTYAVFYYITYILVSILLFVLPYLLAAFLLAGVVFYGWTVAFVNDETTAAKNQKWLWIISVGVLILVGGISFCIYKTPTWIQYEDVSTDNGYKEMESPADNELIYQSQTENSSIKNDEISSTSESDFVSNTTTTEGNAIDYSSLVCDRRLTDADLRGKDKKTLRIMRNTIYARHGYIFKSKDLQEYFSAFSWYAPRKSVVGPEELSEIESYNICLIKSYE